jgi:hypothetical protein
MTVSQIIVASLVIIGCIFGIYYWANHGVEIINCNVFDSNSGCSFDQCAVYFLPYFSGVAFIGIGIAVLFSSFKSETIA